MFTKVIVFALPPVESVDDWIIVELETHVSLFFFCKFSSWSEFTCPASRCHKEHLHYGIDRILSQHIDLIIIAQTRMCGLMLCLFIICHLFFLMNGITYFFFFVTIVISSSLFVLFYVSLQLYLAGSRSRGQLLVNCCR